MATSTIKASSKVYTKGFAKNITVDANSSTGITDDISLSGYTAIGIVGVEANNTFLAVARSSLNSANQTANITFHNYTTSAITSNIAFIVLYVKN